jgi:hypothetical protein
MEASQSTVVSGIESAADHPESQTAFVYSRASCICAIVSVDLSTHCTSHGKHTECTFWPHEHPAIYALICAASAIEIRKADDGDSVKF